MKRRSFRNPNVAIGTHWSALALGAAVVVVGLVLVLLRIFFPGTLTTIASPFWSAGSGISTGIGSFTALFSDKMQLAAQRDELLLQNQALSAKNQSLVEELKAVGDLGTVQSRLMVGVLARPPLSPYDTLIVDGGSGAGAKMGARAYGPGGVPIGTVVAVTRSSARIALYSTPGTSIGGWVGEAHIPVSLIGAGAGAFTATLPKGAKVASGDIVYLPGPGAITAGLVARVDTDPSSPNLTLAISPAINLFSLAWVAIEKEPSL